LIPPDDDGIVVTMSETEPRTVTREEFNRELVQALDDLVADAHHHGELIKAAFDKPYQAPVARESPPPYGEVPERLDRMEGRLERVEGRLERVEGRLDRIDRTLTEIRDQMRTLATKVELEAMNDRIRMVADGYKTVNQRLDTVADLLKVRVILP
jgi:hypothetical protein